MGFHPVAREAMEKDDPGPLAATAGRSMEHAPQQFALRVGKLDENFHQLLWLARVCLVFGTAVAAAGALHYMLRVCACKRKMTANRVSLFLAGPCVTSFDLVPIFLPGTYAAKRRGLIAHLPEFQCGTGTASAVFARGDNGRLFGHVHFTDLRGERINRDINGFRYMAFGVFFGCAH